MEPLLALGLAANVVQFVDFTSKVLSQTVKIYRSKPDSEDVTSGADLHTIGLRVVRYANSFLFDKHVQEYLEGKPLHKILEELEMERLEQQQRMQRREKLRAEHKWVSRVTRMHEQFGNESHSHLTKGPDVETVAQISSCDKEILRTCLGCRAVALELQDAVMNLERSNAKSVWSSFAEALKTVWGDKFLRELKERLEKYRQQMNTLLLVSLRYVLTMSHIFELTTTVRKLKLQ
jgi:hypothetical protein